MVLIKPISMPDHGLMYTALCRFKIGNQIVDSGTLYLTQDTLAWQPESLADGISVQWKQVSLHGISAGGRCIYFMLDHKVVWPGVYDGDAEERNGHNELALNAEPMEQQQQREEQPLASNDVDEGNGTDDEEYAEPVEGGDEVAAGLDDIGDAIETTECWLIPPDNELQNVDTIFRVMNECQSLHPDSADSISDESDFMDDDDGDDMEYMDAGLDHADHGAQGNGHAEAAAGSMRNLSLDDDERFEDAEEE